MTNIPVTDSHTPSDQLRVLSSRVDDSVNFVRRGAFPGAIEARYVRRCAEEIIVYLSSQTGCRKACRFCHLTQSGQTDYVDLSLTDYLDQAHQVLEHYKALVASGEQAADIVNYNFMSRGEVFANPVVLERAPALLTGLAALAADNGLIPRFKFSTIVPTELAERDLAALFAGWAPDIYYSLYSVDEAWRRRWLPKALPAREGLAKVADYARLTRKVPVLHWALIEGENDRPQDLDAIIAAVREVDLHADFNLVRYNPFSAAQGREPAQDVLNRAAHQLAQAFPASRVQIVGRVGHDVKASCGMFVPGTGTRKPEQLMAIEPLPSTASQFVRGSGVAAMK